jgi:hypothetical protein
MKVFLNPVGKGALVNDLFTKREVELSFDFVKVLDEIIKAKKEKKEWVTVDVDRNKVTLISQLLKKKKYDVSIS